MVAQSGKCADIPLEIFSKVIESVYDCALDPSLWQETVGMIAELCRSPYCVLGLIDLENDLIELTFHAGFDNKFKRLQELKSGPMNRYIAPLKLLPVGTVATSAMLVDHHKFSKKNGYDWEADRPQGIGDGMGFKVLERGKRIGALAAHRSYSQGRYGSAEVRTLSLLASHVCRSIAISDALNLQTIRSDALEATLDGVACGIFLTDRQGRIVYMNRAAERQVRIGNVLGMRDNRLIAVERAARTALSKAIAEATTDGAATPSRGITLPLPWGTAGVVATILPLNRGQRRELWRGVAATAAIFVQDPSVEPMVPNEAFAKLYGLTGGELRVLLAMSPGLSIKEVGENLGISEATAKTHLRRIYAKTATSKQTELMRLIRGSMPPIEVAPQS